MSRRSRRGFEATIQILICTRGVRGFVGVHAVVRGAMEPVVLGVNKMDAGSDSASHQINFSS